MDVRSRVEHYAAAFSVEVDSSPFDGGDDGSIWYTKRPSVVKAFYRQDNFAHELECYQRLHTAGVTHKIHEFNIPRFLGANAELLIIEMSIVYPPYILDFGKAYLNDPHWPAHILADWEERMQELWGEEVRRVKLALAALRRVGIWYFDAKPGNIMLADWNPDRSE